MAEPGAHSDAEALFKAALERAPQDRAAFLAQAAPDAPQVREEVASLLQHFEAAGTFLEKPPVVTAAGDRTRALPCH